ncbi:unnamed protein product [Bursaphelenchus xylophilus]|uniref:(pine wood nematode) hypothetical protein n=1 Tax=Bursaphelenchus xylophilus TaxID=6326 RepID=A0A1I7S470_BURXY|nr:unnamed protein product [Bursaphelenchus xylophilus]CAG9116786.1 unnamed protein product [Bursaphelenchus xylophilus]
MSLEIVKRRLCCCLYKGRQSKYTDSVQYNADEHNTVVVTQPTTKTNGFHEIAEPPRINGTTNSGFEDDAQDFDEVNLDEYEVPERYKKSENTDAKKNGDKEQKEVIQVTGLMLDDLYEKNEGSMESEEYREPDANVITSASDEDVKLSQTAGIHRLQIVEKGDEIKQDSRTSTESSSKPRSESNEDTSYSEAITTNIKTTNQTVTTVVKTGEIKTEAADPDVVLQRAAYFNKLPDLEDSEQIIVTATEVRTTKSEVKSPDDGKYVVTDHEAIPNSSLNSPDGLKLDDIQEEDRDSSDKDTSTNTSNRTTDRSRPNVSMYGELNEESSVSSTSRSDPQPDTKGSGLF